MRATRTLKFAFRFFLFTIGIQQVPLRKNNSQNFKIIIFVMICEVREQIFRNFMGFVAMSREFVSLEF